MRTKQLFALSVCNFAIFTVGNSLTGLMPVYLARLGADATVTGAYMAVVFLSMAISTVVGGRLSDYLQRRKVLLILSGALAAPTIWLMSGTSAILPLMILNAFLWFAGGVVVTMVNILAGLFSEEGSRGRIFGLLGLSINIGLLLGALISGPIADRWGFSTLFVLSGFVYLLIPLAGLFVQDKAAAPRQRQGATSPPSLTFLLNRTFLFLFFATILAQVANSLMVMGRPMIMDAALFDATAITTAGAIGVVVPFPLPLIIGWLSDRLGRKPFLILCYLTTPLGLIVLAAAVETWHFWVVSVLQNMLAVSMVVGSALITDRVPAKTLGTALALLNATPWIGYVIGFSAGGAAIGAFQTTPTLIIGVLLSLIAVLLLVPIETRKPAAPAGQAGAPQEA